MNPRRVLHVLDTAELCGTAICRIVEGLATGVDPALYQLDVCFLKPGPLAEHLSRAGIRSTCVTWNGGASDPLGAARYALLLRSGEFSIIHQHTGGRLLTGMGRWLTHARIVRTLHFRANESTGIVPSHFNLPKRDALIAVSQIVADFSRDPRAVVIYPGINASLFPEKRRSHRGFVIGTACRLEPVKGLGYLLEALAVLPHQIDDVRLEIAGEGSLRSFLEQECHRLGISGHVSFIGWREDLPNVMGGWDVFVLPSLDEGFPIAALEAMAAGLPVIASAVGGLLELVQDDETGWLVPAAEPAELTTRLGEIISDDRRREAMGIAGRKRALRDFSIARMVEQTVAVYEGLFTQSRTAADDVPHPVQS
jgi:glycosyltransferase involved in cell wall biosynthesis